MDDGVGGDGAPGSVAGLSGYDLWDRTQEAVALVAAGYGRLVDAGSDQARVAAAPEFLRRVRELLRLRLVAVAAGHRQAFPHGVRPSGRDSVAALWAEVFWAARARSPDDESGLLEATDSAIRGLLALQPRELASSDALRVWWARLAQVEETFGGLEAEAQVTLDLRREAY